MFNLIKEMIKMISDIKNKYINIILNAHLWKIKLEV